MNHTFIAFQINHSELIDRTSDTRTDLGEAIASLTERAVEISVGVYVFNTERDYCNIHDFKNALRAHNRTFCVFEFEDVIQGCFSPTTVERLEKSGLRVLNLKPV